MEGAAKLATRLAQSALTPVINKLASKLGGDVTDAEMEHLNDFVRCEIVEWTRDTNSDLLDKVEKLQAAALEMEDLLDEYEYNQIEKQVSSSSSNCIKEVIAIFLDWLRPILPKSPLRIGLEKLLKFVEQVEKIHPFITSRTDHTTQPPANTITPTTSTLLSPYFGRENQCESIIHFLLDDESHADSSRRTNIVPVIAIIGMGGSGKSHTAQHIYNDNTIKKHFDAIMWVHVTRDFNVERLTRKMFESATSKQCPNFENFDTLQKNLIESLSKDSKRKRFLLVLDDVWCEEKMKWDLLVGPLNEAPGNGSKIIITTRSEKIAYNLNATKFCLEDLEPEECWSVLKHYAFGNSEEIINDQELINVGNQIINKVKHSPLAVKVVGSSLSNKRSVNEWEKILKQDALKETMDLLLFSFQCLPTHLQRCFAYCSLFPKGYEFNFDVCKWKPHLISLWIAQGFIQNTNKSTLEEEGMKYIEELRSYSFFEKKSYCFVIHDLLHDLAEKVSKKQCHRIDYCDSQHIPTTCIHLSLDITEKLVISDIFKLRNLRSLIIFQNSGSINIFKSEKSIFQDLTKLRALYVRYNKQMEVLSDPHIGNLKHLRYLQVQYDRKLPDSLAKLYHLQIFILITNQVVDHKYLQANTVPQGFGNLINLRTLKFYGQYYMDELDYLYYNSNMINVEKLTSLQNLEKLYIDGSNGIMSSRNLPPCKSISILNLENVKSKEEAEAAMLNKKKNLIELVIEWSSTPSSIDTCEEVLEGLEPPENLEELTIRGYKGVTLPKWMVEENRLRCLETLFLQSCTSLKIVQFLPSCLQKLYVKDCCELMQLHPLSENLFTLSIEDCPKFTSLGNLQGCTSLQSLSIRKCPMLMREEHSLMEGVVQDIANRFPPLEHIGTDDPLVVLELFQEQAFSSIKILSIYFTDCAVLPNLEKLSSLEILNILECPYFESLPNLPVSLQHICIRGCPKSKEKHVEGGPLRNTISHIPNIIVD